ncbi:unnamed protein product [Victoria cruziana]
MTQQIDAFERLTKTGLYADQLDSSIALVSYIEFGSEKGGSQKPPSHRLQPFGHIFHQLLSMCFPVERPLRCTQPTPP